MKRELYVSDFLIDKLIRKDSFTYTFSDGIEIKLIGSKEITTSNILVENKALKVENKSLHKQLENEEENNIDSEIAKSSVITGLEIALNKHIDIIAFNNKEIDMLKAMNKSSREDLSIQKGKSFGLGIVNGVLISIIIIQLMRIF